MKSVSWKRNLAILWFAQTLTMVAFSFVFPFIPLYVKTLGIQDDTLAAQWSGFIVAAAAVSMALSQPVWGNMADRFGRRPMVIRSMIGASVTVFLMGIVTSPEQLIVVRFIQGLVSGTVAASTALVATSTPKDKAGFALGMLQTGFFIGSSVGPLVGGLIADNMGFQMAFFVAAAMQAVGALVVFLFVREDFTKPAPGTVKRSSLAESRSIIAIALIPVLLGVIFMVQFGNMIVSPIMALFIESLSGVGEAATAAGVVFAAVGAVSAVSAVVLGRVGDRIGHAVLLPICLIGAALTYFPQAYVDQLWQFLLLRMALGAFLGGLMPAANALVASIVPHQRRGSAFGLTASAQAVANAAGPLLAVGIVSLWSMHVVFIVSGALYLAAYAWVLIGFRRHKVGRFKPKTVPVTSIDISDPLTSTTPGIADTPQDERPDK